MANSIIVMGKSGTGKSTAIKTLNPDETVIINVLNKVLPFRGSKSMYNSEKKNIFKGESYMHIIKLLKGVNDKMPNVKTIIIDDMVYIMRKEFFDRASETGFQKYTDIGSHFQQILDTIEKLREDLNVFLILHSEEVKVGEFTTTQKISTVGKLLDEKYNPIEVVSMLLYSQPKFNENGEPIFGFYTKKRQDNDIEINAKTPEGMFEEDFIPNDYQLVIDKVKEYFL